MATDGLSLLGFMDEQPLPCVPMHPRTRTDKSAALPFLANETGLKR